jgi:hypothetical protein
MFECDFYKKSVKGILVFTRKEGGVMVIVENNWKT